MLTFEERHKMLNPEQREAVDTLRGMVMVIAGPGTGKTEILTMRVANILRGGDGGAGSVAAKTAGAATPLVAPEKILALTFTEVGAATMRRRLVELVGQQAYRVEISTFHGFANRIIRDYPDYFPEIIGSTSITDIDQIDILQRLIDTPSLELAKLRPFGDTYYYLRDILRAVSDLKQQGVTPVVFAKIAADEKTEFYANPDLFNTSGKYEGKMKGKYDSGAKMVEKNLELARVYEAYQAALRAAKQYDYNDMIMFVAGALEANEDLRRVLQDAYEYFLVDEHQDTNDAQNKIIELLADGGGVGGVASDGSARSSPNLFVVGDEKQAIFRFQGASLENFHYFQKRYPSVKLISLRSNYRSTQAILNAAQEISPREVGLVAKAGHVEHPANLVVLPSPDAELFFVAEKIKELLTGAVAVPAEEVAILYRDNRDAVPMARMLEKLRVPFNIESDQDILSDLEIRKLFRILRAVQHFGNDVWLIEALHVDFLGIAPLDLYKLSYFAKKSSMSVYYFLKAVGEGTRSEFQDAPVQKTAADLFEKFSRWKRVADNAGAAEAFEMIVRESGFLASIVNHPSGPEKVAKLHALFDLLKSFVERNKNYTLKDFFAHLDLMEEHGLALKSKDTVRMPGRVRLMTAHRSKGLEFDYVFIINAIDRKWGSRMRRESLTLPKGIYRVGAKAAGEDASEEAVDDNADERNVFYVALTRARKELFITRAKNDREGKELLPTQFIAELKPEILAPYDAAAYEKEFAALRDDVEFGEPAPRKPELADKVFLNALFEEQGLSVTAINNYRACPWHYFYVNLVRVPEAPNKHLSFGNAIHAALKSYFDAFAAAAASAGEKSIDPGKAYLIQRFEEALAGEPLKESDYQEGFEKGRRALGAYFDEYRAGWSPNGRDEVRIDGVQSGDVKIKGNLDRVEDLDPAGAVGGAAASEPIPVRVIDYKTGHPKSRNDIEGKTQSSDGNYKRQLVFYKLLLEKEGRRDMREGVIQFIEPDECGKFHREVFEIAPAEIAELETDIARIADEIRTLAFWDTYCDEKDCKYCELRRMVG